MTTTEFSNEFDVLYNNIMSNQAPGLNEYEKSVFLTKAQNELIQNHFNPDGNKYKSGFDGNEKRQIDFSELMMTANNAATYGSYTGTPTGCTTPITITAKTPGTTGNVSITGNGVKTVTVLISEHNASYPANELRLVSGIGSQIISSVTISLTSGTNTASGISTNVSLLKTDDRGTMYNLPEDVLLIINESALISDGSEVVQTQVIPIGHGEYARLMSKPYKEPLKYQSWRIMSGSSAGLSINCEIITRSGYSISKYVVRYVKRPSPIILATLDSSYGNVTIDNIGTVSQCILNPIIHREILDRAVELAKAAYTGDIKAIVDLNQRNE